MRTFIVALVFALAASGVMSQEKEILFETTAGNIRIMLYDETPQHRDNFLKLVRMHFYDSLLFHRVIPNFMIQAGDPKSRTAESGAHLGTGTLDYNIPAEIRFPKYYHKRGAVAMAREGDRTNPQYASDACQFYIVIGKRMSSEAILNTQEHLDTVAASPITLTPEIIETYRKTGGTPHLDGTYTVFGEVLEGMDVAERIQKAFTDDYDRPVDDIRILRATVINDDAPKKQASAR